MALRMNLKVRFNRPVNTKKYYIVAGGFKMTIGGKNFEFDFAEQEFFVDADEPCAAVFCLRKLLYDDFPDFEKMTGNELKNISEIKECFIYTGESGENDLFVVKTEDIYFVETAEKEYGFSVNKAVIDKFNLGLSA